MRNLATTLVLLLPTVALADDEQTTAPPTAEENLPAPKSDNDPAPPVASSGFDVDANVVEQAGVGGDTGYGRQGVLELGGYAGMMIAPGFRNINVSPMFGWFVADNLELSAIVGVSNIKAGDQSATVWSALVEPSYHVPFNRTTFGFIGMGVGASYVSELGAGLAVAPRIGANVMVGRSGVLTPSLSYEYTTHNVESVEGDEMKNVTLVAVSSAMRINIGYTAMW